MTEAEMQPNSALEPQIISRVASIPLVTTACGQLTTLYQQTKDSNKYIKYTLETAETSVKTVATTAMPLVNKLEKPISTLDHLACDSLDKLEERYPLIKQPSGEVYEGTIKPVVDYSMDKVSAAKDQVNYVTKMSVDTVNCAKDYGTNKVKMAKDTINQARALSVDTINSAKDYSYDQAQNVKKYTYSQLDNAKSYSMDKLQVAMETPYGQMASSQLDRALDWTEGLMDYYLPEDKSGEDGEKVDEEKTVSEGSLASVQRAAHLTTKAKQRMYTHTMRNLKHIQMRTQETLEKLNFTVDLIQYAKTNIDNVSSNVTTKLNQYWTEVNASEEEAAEITVNNENIDTNQNILERRIIATARHLTLRVKGTVARLSDSVSYLPQSVTDRVANVKNYSEELYNSFASVTSIKDLPTYMLDQTKEKVSYIQETMTYVGEYIVRTPLINWMGLQSNESAEEQLQALSSIPSDETETTPSEGTEATPEPSTESTHQD